MAAGTPVVATQAGALPEVLRDGARFVEPGDTDGLAAALRTVLDDDHARNRLVDAGRARAARFSWDACAAGVVALYQHLC
jgi:glycosyltransferase involved in cell wall biosynthesis